ncbi:hypothetical protein N5C43_21765 [Comamonas terrigena]|uniref:hypothetical protein n=1 Tax=Comamonas terrigena TaxID=32013 RepID=UPI00244A0EE9|nr:hypothetical protein [Comamonas terrigena]MDH1293869.1 hypothetical protein [Comamonas terrigena]
MSTRIQDLAQLIVQAQELGVIEAWREYITCAQVQAGISNQMLKVAVEQEKRKK